MRGGQAVGVSGSQQVQRSQTAAASWAVAGGPPSEGGDWGPWEHGPDPEKGSCIAEIHSGYWVQGLSCRVSEKDELRGAPGSSAQDGHAGHLLSSVDTGREARRGLGTFYSPFPDKGIKSHNI